MDEITTQDLVNAWVDVVIDEIKDFERMHDMCRDEGDGKWFMRSHTTLWGAYWTIRKITGALSFAYIVPISSHSCPARAIKLCKYC